MIRRLVAAALMALCVSAARAEDAVTVVVSPGGAEEAAKLVDALRRNGTTVVVRVAGAAEGQRDAGSAAGTGDSGPPSDSSLAALFNAGLRQGVEAIPSIPRMIGEVLAAWSRGANSAGAVVLAWLAALAAGLAARRALRWWSPATARHGLAGRLFGAALGLIRDLAAIAAFVAAGRIMADLLLPAPDFRRTVAIAILDGAAYSLLYVAGGRFLLAPGAPERRLLPLERADRHRTLLVAYGVADQVISTSVDIGLAATAGAAGVEGWFLLADTAITAFVVWWFLDLRRDVARLVRNCAADPASPGAGRRVAAAIAPWAMVAVSVLMWSVGRVAAVSPDGVRWGDASQITQVLAVLIPLTAVGGAALLRGLLAPAAGSDAPLARALAAMAAAAAAGAVWIGGFLLLARIWSFFLSDAAVAGLAQALSDATDDATVLAIGWLTWSFVRQLFDAYRVRPPEVGPGGVVPGELPVAPHSRVATVLPLLRGLALSTVVSVTALVSLSKLGVNIGPLLAGAGVVGLAISFGSQALVRDIVSGIFFMMDDAFRVGEYVDTGRQKGTVEKLSLRSMLLRHQSGQLHTVPYGQIASVTNASRDWATVKFNIPLAHGADLDQIRKLVKKVGQRLLDDPERGPEFIQPLKLQGMAAINDGGLVIRLKFTARPAKASWLQREALKRVYEALVEAGVAFPVGVVAAPGVPPAAPAGAAATR